MRRMILMIVVIALVVSAAIAGLRKPNQERLGKQPDGSFVVSTGQHIEGDGLTFNTRPVDMALHPVDDVVAVLAKSSVLLCDSTQVIKDSSRFLPDRLAPGYRGCIWNAQGTTLYVSTNRDAIQTFTYSNRKIERDQTIPLGEGRFVPGGLALTRDGSKLYVACANRNAVVEFDLTARKMLRELPVENIPFEPQLSADEKTLVVSNWGGRITKEGEDRATSDHTMIAVDKRGAPASGTVSIIDLATGDTTHLEVGIHPTAIALRGDIAYVANAMSDSISILNIRERSVTGTIPIRWGDQRVVGNMPSALVLVKNSLLVANGGDNAVAQIDLASNKIVGFRHAGYFPIAIAARPDASTAFVLNTKGNGSVARTSIGKPGNAHDFQGTINVIDLNRPIEAETAIVARNNRWDTPIGASPLKVYNGAIKHVLYIIKENRTYDEVFGDLPKGNGDPKLCSLGEKIMPNTRKIANEFCLFDNGYVSGTNSADGHAWSTQALASDYLEHFYVGYSRSYPDDGDDAMAISTGGCLWDAAVLKNRSVRVYGEFCDNDLARIEPQPADWFEVYNDWKAGKNSFKFFADTKVAGLKPHIHPEIHYWPLWMCDQIRADLFIKEFNQFVQDGKVPNLMILSLPCDHGEGTNPKYPTPRAMMADNDLALGRVVEAVSRSAVWKETCIFVIEDDAQSGPDHVDGHRTVFLAISPYTKRGHLDSTLYTNTHMIRSIEMMLGLDPMNKFDALSYPMEDCFSDTPDLTPFQSVPNNIPLDERNPSGAAMTEQDKYWLEKTLALDWSHIDAPDPYWLNRINWYSIYKGTRPYPDRPGDAPGQFEEEDDEEHEDDDHDEEASIPATGGL